MWFIIFFSWNRKNIQFFVQVVFVIHGLSFYEFANSHRKNCSKWQFCSNNGFSSTNPRFVIQNDGTLNRINLAQCQKNGNLFVRKKWYDEPQSYYQKQKCKPLKQLHYLEPKQSKFFPQLYNIFCSFTKLKIGFRITSQTKGFCTLSIKRTKHFFSSL